MQFTINKGKTGDDVPEEEKEQVQKLTINDVSYDRNKYVYLDGTVYKFAVSTSSTDLRIFYLNTKFTYSFSYLKKNDNSEYILFNGKVLEEYKNKYFAYSLYETTDSEIHRVKIQDDCTFKLEIPVNSIKMDTQTRVHAYLYDTETSTNNILSGTTGAFDLIPGASDTVFSPVSLPDFTGWHWSLTNAYKVTTLNGDKYHIGYFDGQNYINIFRQGAICHASLRAVNDGSDKGVYLDVNRPLNGAARPETIYFNLEHDDECQKKIKGTSTYVSSSNKHEFNAVQTKANSDYPEYFSFSIRLDDLTDTVNVNSVATTFNVKQAKFVFISHIDTTKTNFDTAIDEENKEIVFDGVKYRITNSISDEPGMNGLKASSHVNRNSGSGASNPWRHNLLEVLTEPVD